jgi:serine/threonine protein kinase
MEIVLVLECAVCDLQQRLFPAGDENGNGSSSEDDDAREDGEGPLLSESNCRQVARALLTAVCHLHASRIVHRDIKVPAHLILLLEYSLTYLPTYLP